MAIVIKEFQSSFGVGNDTQSKIANKPITRKFQSLFFGVGNDTQWVLFQISHVFHVSVLFFGVGNDTSGWTPGGYTASSVPILRGWQ